MASAKRAWQWVVPLVSVVALALPAQSRELGAPPSPLLAIDQNRVTVAERIVSEWGTAIGSAGITADQLRELLLGMRADQLLAASLAGSLEGLRNAVSNALLAETEVKPSLLQAKALGDGHQDLVYVPVTPCRLVDTRGTFSAVYPTGGAYASAEVRTYKVEGGNGVCLSQLPASVNPTAVQVQVFALPTTGGSGDVEMLPQGSTFGSTATLVFLGNVPVTTVSTTTLLNVVNKTMSVQVRGGGLHLAIDVVGYFRAAGGFVSSVTAGAGLTGGTITNFGTIAVDATYLQRRVGGSCGLGYAMREIRADGSVLCEAIDIDGTGTVTSISTGQGLTGGPITTTGTISLAATQLLPTVACASSQVPGWSGSAWTCANPGSPGNNVSLPDSTPTVGNIVKPGGIFMHNIGGSTSLGIGAGGLSMTGQGNTAIGTFAMGSNIAGEFNTAVGVGALESLDGAASDHNTAVGYWAMRSATAGSFSNTAAGAYALSANTSGKSNTAMGAWALQSNTIGYDNAAFGDGALQVATTGIANTAIGYRALASNDSGVGNAALGHAALLFNTIGSGNVAVGLTALESATSSNNTAVGSSALKTNTTGEFNLALGAAAGWNLTTGDHNIHLSHMGVAGEGRTIRIGTPGDQDRAFISGIRGVTTANNNAINVVIDSAGQLGTLSSSMRVKDDVADMGDASDVLMKLHPVTFRYKAHGASGSVQYGLIAEEVAGVAPGLVASGRDGEVETVFYQHLPPMLLNEYQKQKRTIDAQAAALRAQGERIAAMEAEQRQRAVALEVEEAKRSAEVADLRRAVEVLLARTQPEGKIASR